MKKIYILNTFLIILLLCGCSSKGFNTSHLNISNTIADCDNITLTVEEPTIKSFKEPITLIFKNTSNQEYCYGVDFKLEINLDDEWYEVPFTSGEFIDIGIILDKNAEREETIDLSKYFSNLPEGTYRIVKTFYSNGLENVVVGSFKIEK